MKKYVCSNCGYKTKKEKTPERCNYCGQKTMYEEEEIEEILENV